MKYILYSAGYMDWKPVGKFTSLKDLKTECIKHYGYPQEIMENDISFEDYLDGYEMKYETI